MQKDIYHLVYVSEAVGSWDKPQLEKLLNHSRSMNEKYRISGVLLASFGYFFQFLEGPKIKVNELYLKIMQDNRHHNVQCIYTKTAQDRIFSDWSMAYKEMNEYGSEVKKVFADFRRYFMSDSAGLNSMELLSFLENIRKSY